ncbi:MAG TPA: hypothetical protein VN083_01350 [Vicinamibacteria bacterium]|nr:hypothetical protein [Vicinamibacteria bacterium]
MTARLGLLLFAHLLIHMDSGVEYLGSPGVVQEHERRVMLHRQFLWGARAMGLAHPTGRLVAVGPAAPVVPFVLGFTGAMGVTHFLSMNWGPAYGYGAHPQPVSTNLRN